MPLILVVLAAQLFSAPVDVFVPKAPTAVRANGADHVVYELHLTNFGSAEREIRSLAVLDDATSATLATYEGAALAAMIAHPGAPSLKDKQLIAGGGHAVVFLDVKISGAVPKGLRHRLGFATDSLEGAKVALSSERALVITPPLSGGRWLAMHGLSNESTHRRTIVVVNGSAHLAQRFATDWTRIGPNGLAYHDDPATLSNWYAYGAEVLAVADGTVVEVNDGVPENDPTSDKKAVPITLETAGGNYILLDLGNGRIAFYAHLQPNAIRVRRGDRVRRGQTIALLGNSGNSDAPHLHFHITDAPSPLGAEGVPYVLRHFDVLGSVESLRTVAEGSGWKQIDAAMQKENEIPVENSVVSFPDVR